MKKILKTAGIVGITAGTLAFAKYFNENPEFRDKLAQNLGSVINKGIDKGLDIVLDIPSDEVFRKEWLGSGINLPTKILNFIYKNPQKAQKILDEVEEHKINITGSGKIKNFWKNGVKKY